MRYARLENEKLTPAPKTVTIGSQTVCNPTLEQYLSIGWYPVVFTDVPELPPDSLDMAVPHWEQVGQEIRQVWVIVPIPEPEPPKPHVPTLEDRVTTMEQKTAENRELIDILVSGQTGEVIPNDIPGIKAESI